jgi:hypothetical protein
MSISYKDVTHMVFVMGMRGNDYCNTVYRKPGRKLENLGVGGRIVMLRDIGWPNVGCI